MGGEISTCQFLSSWSGMVDENIGVLLSRHFPPFWWNILEWLMEERGTPFPFLSWDLGRKPGVGCRSLCERMWKCICAYVRRPKNNLSCHLLGTVCLVYCLSFVWNSASRLAWMASEHQESTCINLSRVRLQAVPSCLTFVCGFYSLYSGHHAWKQALYWQGHVISLFILTNK